MSKKYVAKA